MPKILACNELLPRGEAPFHCGNAEMQPWELLGILCFRMLPKRSQELLRGVLFCCCFLSGFHVFLQSFSLICSFCICIRL